MTNVFRTITNSLNYELGLGFDFYLFYFKFSPSIRGIFSFENELIMDEDPYSPWTGKILNMFSRKIRWEIGSYWVLEESDKQKSPPKMQVFT